MTSYDPESKISLGALMKLEMCTGYKVLTELQNSQRKRETLKNKAGFSFSNIRLSNVYKDLQAAAKCINSWIADENAALSPTWNNFLHVLREPGMDLGDLADKIQIYLASTVGNASDQVDTEPSSKVII